MRVRRSALFVLMAGAVAAPLPALAQARLDVRDASQRCDRAGIADDRVWLECYYGAAQAMRSRLGLPPAPASQQRLVPQASSAPVPAPVARAPATPPPPRVPDNAAPLPRRSDGWLGSFGGGKVVRTSLRIESVGTGRSGLVTVAFGNGESWEVVSGGSGNPNWGSRAVARISEGVLGTYNMKVTNDPALYKVRRVNLR